MSLRPAWAIQQNPISKKPKKSLPPTPAKYPRKVQYPFPQEIPFHSTEMKKGTHFIYNVQGGLSLPQLVSYSEEVTASLYMKASKNSQRIQRPVSQQRLKDNTTK
jgi:hypothetical protein